MSWMPSKKTGRRRQPDLVPSGIRQRTRPLTNDTLGISNGLSNRDAVVVIIHRLSVRVIPVAVPASRRITVLALR